MYKEQICSLDYCDRSAVGLAKNTGIVVCNTHYVQDLAGRHFTPIKAWKRLHKDEDGRVCKTCDRYKTWDNFYKHSYRESRNSECKECQYQRARRNLSARQAVT